MTEADHIHDLNWPPRDPPPPSGPIAEDPRRLAQQLVSMYERKLLEHHNCRTCPGQAGNPLRQCDRYRAAWQALLACGVDPNVRLPELLAERDGERT